jgi:hypothetical protein
MYRESVYGLTTFVEWSDLPSQYTQFTDSPLKRCPQVFGLNRNSQALRFALLHGRSDKRTPPLLYWHASVGACLCEDMPERSVAHTKSCKLNCVRKMHSLIISLSLYTNLCQQLKSFNFSIHKSKMLILNGNIIQRN